MKSNLNRALSYCSKNIRCKSELKAKIRSWNLDTQEEDDIINFLDLHNFYFSDEEYLDKYFENLSSVKGQSKLQIKKKLLQKKIPLKLIEFKLNEYFRENEGLEVRKFIQKNLRKITSKPREVAIKYVLSKGFKYDMVLKTFKELNL